jgi:AraC-like DNA-binding protein
MIATHLARSFKTAARPAHNLVRVRASNPPSVDFASAALVAMVRRALAEMGLVEPTPCVGAAPLLPLASKREFLGEIATAHGLQPLMAAGRYLARMPHDPAAAALLAAADPSDLFARWARLERFVHSRHRVIVREAGERHLVAEHVSTTEEPPRAFEDALILGILTVALAATGAVGVTARLGRDPDAPLAIDGDATRAPKPEQGTSIWRFDWRNRTPRSADAHITDTGDAAAMMRRLVTADPARGWTVAAAGAALNRSPRSLQRALSSAGGFAAVVAAARAERAADLLINAEHPLSNVGFACGYADQPHFTREFKRRTAMTPAAYRRAFAAGRSAA